MKENGGQRPWILATLILSSFIFLLSGCGRKGSPVAPEDAPSNKNLSSEDREESN